MYGGHLPVLGKAMLLLFHLVFVRLVCLVLLIGVLVAQGAFSPQIFATGVRLLGSGSGSFWLVVSTVVWAHVQASLGAGWQKCLGVWLRVRLLTLGLVLLLFLGVRRRGGSFLCMASSRFILCHLCFEAFAALHVHLKPLPGWEYFF